MTKIHCLKLPGQRLKARDFDCRVAELKVRIAVLNGTLRLAYPSQGPLDKSVWEKGEPANHPIWKLSP